MCDSQGSKQTHSDSGSDSEGSLLLRLEDLSLLRLLLLSRLDLSSFSLRFSPSPSLYLSLLRSLRAGDRLLSFGSWLSRLEDDPVSRDRLDEVDGFSSQTPSSEDGMSCGWVMVRGGDRKHSEFQLLLCSQPTP